MGFSETKLDIELRPGSGWTSVGFGLSRLELSLLWLFYEHDRVNVEKGFTKDM